MLKERTFLLLWGTFCSAFLEARVVASVISDQLVGMMGFELFPALGSKTMERNAAVEVSEAWQLTRLPLRSGALYVCMYLIE